MSREMQVGHITMVAAMQPLVVRGWGVNKHP